MTTGRGHEGDSGQHVVSVISRDRGQTWEGPFDIEPDDGPEASWVMPLLVPETGRIYAFYTYNGDEVRELAGRPIRAALVGGLIYVYAPYHLLTIYVRAAFAEFSAMAGFPRVLVAFDILPMDGVHGAVFIQGDFREDAALAQPPFAEPFHMESSAWVSNRLCEVLPVPLKAKQRLMELTDAPTRLQIVHTYLKQHSVLA